MVTTLGGITLNIKDDAPSHKADIIKNKIAGYGRFKIHNNGVVNIGWRIKGWVNSAADEAALAALMGQSSLTFVDKNGNSFTVTIEALEFGRKNYAHTPYSLTIIEE